MSEYDEDTITEMGRLGLDPSEFTDADLVDGVDGEPEGLVPAPVLAAERAILAAEEDDR